MYSIPTLRPKRVSVAADSEQEFVGDGCEGESVAPKNNDTKIASFTAQRSSAKLDRNLGSIIKSRAMCRRQGQ